MDGEVDIAAGVAEISSSLFESGDLTGSKEGVTPPVEAPADKTASTEPKAAPASQEPAAAKPPVEAPTGTPPAVSSTPAPGPTDAPKTWSKEGQALWATLPPAAQAEVRKREEDFHRGIEGYKADAADGKVFQQVLNPYKHILQHYNINPIPLISGLMKAHHDLATGSPEDKVALFRKLAADYGVNLETAAAPAPYEDPAVTALREENQRLKSQTREIEQQASSAFQATLNQQLDAFEADPKHPHFKEVGHDMVPFLNAGMSLEAAYEKAVWANPKTRALEQTRLSADAAKVESERVAAAKRAAAANVRTSARSGSATAPLGSMDDTMAETLAKIRNR